MKMFRIIYKPVVLLMAAAVSFTACEVDTTTVMFEEDHDFSQPNDTVFSMLGILTKVQNVAERGVLLGEIRGDLVKPDPFYENSDKALFALSRFENLEDTTYNCYRDYYAIINNCNFYLDRADAEMERRGEKVFLKEYAAVSSYRAWAYLQLALLYGKVPFYTKPLLSYSDIEQVMNDPSNRKGLGEICSYFIQDLKSYVDVPFPDYKDFTYNTDKTVNSEEFFLPVRLLLGDLYLWRGSETGSQSDYSMAAQEYRDYLMTDATYLSPRTGVVYKTADLGNQTISDGWSSIFSGGNSGERISLIPFACADEFGKAGTLWESFRYFTGSDALKSLVSDAYYCYVMYTEEDDLSGTYLSRFTGLVEDTQYYGTPEKPDYYSYITVSGIPQYFMGDLRFIRYMDSDGDLNVGKYSQSWPHVSTYRVGTVYLRLAEAINRSGFPLTAFHILKYGLSRGNLIKYDANGEFQRLRSSGYTFYEMYDNMSNIGIHARGCGNAEMDTLHYSLPAMASREDSIKRVEDMICDEMALETAYEGNRFYDLMRFAFRRGEDYLASRVARRSNPDMPDQALYNKLKDRNNWYLPMVEN